MRGEREQLARAIRSQGLAKGLASRRRITGSLGDTPEGHETRKARKAAGVSATPEITEFPCGGIVMDHEITVPPVVSRGYDCAPPVIVVLPVLLAEEIR
jgi:hypothetical protein